MCVNEQAGMLVVHWKHNTHTPRLSFPARPGQNEKQKSDFSSTCTHTHSHTHDVTCAGEGERCLVNTYTYTHLHTDTQKMLPHTRDETNIAPRQRTIVNTKKIKRKTNEKLNRCESDTMATPEYQILPWAVQKFFVFSGNVSYILVAYSAAAAAAVVVCLSASLPPTQTVFSMYAKVHFPLLCAVVWARPDRSP